MKSLFNRKKAIAHLKITEGGFVEMYAEAENVDEVLRLVFEVMSKVKVKMKVSKKGIYL